MNEIVMGLKWTPAFPHLSSLTPDLDALCVLLDERNDVIDVISPSRPRTVSDSVVHTGNSHDGANAWDDERIYVFLDALPTPVSQIIFCVQSAGGQSFSRVAAARCHLSDARREQLLASFDLTTECEGTFLPVFRLYREGANWHLVDQQPDPSEGLRTTVLCWQTMRCAATATPAG